MSKKKKKISKNKRKSVKQKTEPLCREVVVLKDLGNQAKLTGFVIKEENDNGHFLKELNKTIKDLIYISETDSDIFPFIGEKIELLDVESFINQIGINTDKNIEEIKFYEFFVNLIVIEDWFEDEEKETAEKFLKLKNLLEENLKDLKGFKVGEIELEIYVVGLDKENNLLGIKTEAVET